MTTTKYETIRTQYNKLEMHMAETEASWAQEQAQAATNVDGLKCQLEESKRVYEEAVSEVRGGKWAEWVRNEGKCWSDCEHSRAKRSVTSRLGAPGHASF